MHTHSHATQDRPRPASVSWNLLAAIVLFAAITPTILMTAPAVAAQELLQVMDTLPEGSNGGFFDHHGTSVPW